jgi:hypothetical protein
MADPDSASRDDSTLGTSSPGIVKFVSTASERFLAASGVCLVMVSVFSFGAIVFKEITGGFFAVPAGPGYWATILFREAPNLVLLVIGIVCALLGLRLLTTTQTALARTIPKEDLLMVQEAVINGKSEAIDQYVRLRSLAGWAGTFTKLGITGLPLVTVVLTLIFSLIALLPLSQADAFLDLAKLTLGAFIGSFVQRNVELRKQDISSPGAKADAVNSGLPV